MRWGGRGGQGRTGQGRIGQGRADRAEQEASCSSCCSPCRNLALPCRVVLIDDDAHKALPQEQRNLVHVPCWEDDDWQGDPLEVLVQALEEVLGPLGPGAYTRQYTERVMQRLAY